MRFSSLFASSMGGSCTLLIVFFFFNDTATTEIYTLSLHDALPISAPKMSTMARVGWLEACAVTSQDRKSTRLNSSYITISYAVFCLKKKKHTTRDNLHKVTKVEPSEDKSSFKVA